RETALQALARFPPPADLAATQHNLRCVALTRASIARLQRNDFAGLRNLFAAAPMLSPILAARSLPPQHLLVTRLNRPARDLPTQAEALGSREPAARRSWQPPDAAHRSSPAAQSREERRGCGSRMHSRRPR